jgi:hypothetical protein
MEDFKENILDIAKRECKGEATKEEVLWLQNPDNQLAWLQSLVTALSDYENSAMYHRERVNMMAQDVKLGVISHREYLEEKEKFDTWYRKSQRYRNGLSARLNQVKILIGENKTVDLLQEVARLSRAIIDHENRSSESEKAPNPWDVILWSSVQVLDV